VTLRERTLTIMLLGLIFLAVSGFVGYFLFLRPIQSRNAQAAKLAQEITTLEEEIASLQQQARRLPQLQERSLPNDPILAREEYKEALSILLRQANAPPGFTIIPRSGDTQTVPNLAPKKPAYTRLVFDINLDKVDLKVLATFLESYYQMNLSHQITGLTIKRPEETRSAASDRKDLKVTITTEAVIMDGADNRKTLLAVPTSFAAAGGSLGFQALRLTPEVGRGLLRVKDASVLAPSEREYAVLFARDFFHGPLPPPPPPPKPVETPRSPPPPPPPPPPPKEDISPYIRLVGLTIRSNRTALVEIWDAVNNSLYEIETGDERTRVQKFLRNAEGFRRPDESYTATSELHIADPASSTNRRFRLVAVDATGIYLAESKTTKMSVLEGRSALLGSAAAAEEAVVLYHWMIGQTLNELMTLSEAAARELLRRAAAALTPEPAPPPARLEESLDPGS